MYVTEHMFLPCTISGAEADCYLLNATERPASTGIDPSLREVRVICCRIYYSCIFDVEQAAMIYILFTGDSDWGEDDLEWPQRTVRTLISRRQSIHLTSSSSE